MNNIKRYTRTLLCAAGFLATAFVAGCGGGGEQGRDPILGVPAATLVSVSVTPAAPSVAIGGTQQFAATATYSDNTSRDVTNASTWTSASAAVATVNPATGLARGVTAGTSLITAAFSGKSGSSTLTVTPATLVSMALLPANPTIALGATQQFSVLGTFSDNTTRDITAVSTFTSATVAVGSIGAGTGLATGVTAGTSLITATSSGRSASTTLTVSPAVLMSLAIAPVNPIVQIGANRQLAVTATYSDGSTANVTAASLYSSAAPAIATVNANGLATGVTAGNSVVTASFNGKTANTTVTVPATTLVSIDVTPALATIGTGGTQQFTATGTYADGSTGIITNSVTWTSGTTAVATIMSNGMATGLSAGDSVITATLGANSDTAVLTVTAALVPVGPVLLGRADSFAVLAGTALTNNSGGTTVVSGDVGSPSQTTDPVQSSGTNYKSGAILDGALADLQTAITDANSRICNVSSAADIDLGGLTLSPGVYCYTGKINITGILTLNGPGVYIFRTDSTLDSAVNSTVNLIGGATADNVYWVPVMPTTLAANTTFVGSILARSAAITLGDTTTVLNGRVLSGAAVTLRNNKITK